MQSNQVSCSTHSLAVRAGGQVDFQPPLDPAPAEDIRTQICQLVAKAAKWTFIG